MNNYVKQAYKKAKHNIQYYTAPHEMLSDAFFDAALQMTQIAQACEHKHIEKRANLSEKIIITLNGILNILDANYDTGPKSIPLYMQAINQIIRGLSHVNIKNDAAKAMDLSSELTRLGELIRN